MDRLPRRGLGPALALMLASVLLFAACSAAPAAPTAVPTAPPVAQAQPVPTAVATAVPSPTPAPSPTPLPPTATATASATASPVEAILSKVAALRGLQIKEKVPLGYLARDQVRPYFAKQAEAEHTRQDLARDKALFVSLDLLNDSDDLYDMWLGLLSEQVIGFYEFEGREMKLVGDGKAALSTLDELTLAHEYVHALQDQNFGLGAKVKQLEGQSERELALQSLSEGDATLAMALYARQYKTVEQIADLQAQSTEIDQQKLQAAPSILQAQLLFPYQQGMTFVASLASGGGWTAVDKAYANPPQTSEQIMHPEKYRAGEGAKRVEMPNLSSALGQGWVVQGADTFGELGWLVYLLGGVQTDLAQKAAAGWGGDSCVVYKNAGGRYVLAALTTWDSANDAKEFFTAVRGLRTARGDKLGTATASNFGWTSKAASGYAGLKDKQVLIVVAPDAGTASRVAARFGGF